MFWLVCDILRVHLKLLFNVWLKLLEAALVLLNHRYTIIYLSIIILMSLFLSSIQSRTLSGAFDSNQSSQSGTFAENQNLSKEAIIVPSTNPSTKRLSNRRAVSMDLSEESEEKRAEPAKTPRFNEEEEREKRQIPYS